MIQCTSCETSNANKNSFCAACGTRIRPVSTKFKNDVNAVLDERNHKARKQRLVLAGLGLSALGFFGYSTIGPVVRSMVNTELARLKPIIETEVTTQARVLIETELPKAVNEVKAVSLTTFAAALKETHSRRQREIDQIYEDAVRTATTFASAKASAVEYPQLYSARTSFSVSVPSIETLGNQRTLDQLIKVYDGIGNTMLENQKLNSSIPDISGLSTSPSLAGLAQSDGGLLPRFDSLDCLSTATVGSDASLGSSSLTQSTRCRGTISGANPLSDLGQNSVPLFAPVSSRTPIQ